MYLYANYESEYFGEGLLLTSFNVNTLTYGKTSYYPYADDILQKLKKMNIAQKNKSVISIVPGVNFDCVELEDGTLAFYGTTEIMSSVLLSNGGSLTKSYAGAIINCFVKNGKCDMSAIYRKIPAGRTEGIIAIPNKNNLLLIYNDNPKNITIKNTDDYESIERASKLVLAQATLSARADVISKQQITENMVGDNYFFTNSTVKISNTQYLVPIGRDGANLSRYVTTLVQWGIISIAK